MLCPFCQKGETKVVDSRGSQEFVIRRRRECLDCGRRFTTYEKIEESPLKVIKKDGSRVPFDRDNERLYLSGMEDLWSRECDPERSLAGIPHDVPRVVLAHNPLTVERLQGRRCDLMLSGHTHGMQFGVEIPGFKWSPVQYMYKQWAGVYEDGKQKLNVNRGFGFIGYPGRLGILPEITVLELV